MICCDVPYILLVHVPTSCRNVFDSVVESDDNFLAGFVIESVKRCVEIGGFCHRWCMPLLVVVMCPSRRESASATLNVYVSCEITEVAK